MSDNVEKGHSSSETEQRRGAILKNGVIGHVLTDEDRARGSAKSAENRKKRKQMEEVFDALLTKRIKSQGLLGKYEELGVITKGKDGKLPSVSVQQGVALGVIMAAIGGDSRAFAEIMKVIEPETAVEAETEDLDAIEEELFGGGDRE